MQTTYVRTPSPAPRAVAPPEAPYTPPLYSRILSAIVAFGPPVLLLFVIFRGTGGPVGWRELAVAALFVVVIGHAVTIGFHRLFTHRSFVAKRPLKISLAVLGTMSFQGSLIGWVADHRRHHRFSERSGDPHSPWCEDDEPTGGWRGFWHAHIGWCFSNRPTSRTEYAPDLLADPDLASGPLVVVVGSEGDGLGRLVSETCDRLVSIPMSSSLESLNAGVAASITLYALAQHR